MFCNAKRPAASLRSGICERGRPLAGPQTQIGKMILLGLQYQHEQESFQRNACTLASSDALVQCRK
jgi:hypothetical protein